MNYRSLKIKLSSSLEDYTTNTGSNITETFINHFRGGTAGRQWPKYEALRAKRKNMKKHFKNKARFLNER